MPDKKFIEQNHYDRKVLDHLQLSDPDSGNINLADKALRAAHYYFDQVVNEVLVRRKKGTILDYGCGTGTRTINYVSEQWQLTGIDISPESIKIAEKISKQKGIVANYKIMDCEKMQFADGSFDLVLDYGTFSSLDIHKAMTEIIRVLKKNGMVIAIETFGHNPLFNFKRKLNVLTKKRTAWAAEHIMKNSDWAYVTSLFEFSEIKYFAFLTPFSVPFLKITPGKYRNQLTEKISGLDNYLLKHKYLQKWAFKTVAVLTNPIKQ